MDILTKRTFLCIVQNFQLSSAKQKHKMIPNVIKMTSVDGGFKFIGVCNNLCICIAKNVSFLK